MPSKGLLETISRGAVRGTMTFEAARAAIRSTVVEAMMSIALIEAMVSTSFSIVKDWLMRSVSVRISCPARSLPHWLWIPLLGRETACSLPLALWGTGSLCANSSLAIRSRKSASRTVLFGMSQRCWKCWHVSTALMLARN
ncbi:hypothetical protein D3C71_1474320 [compost metagenome]